MASVASQPHPPAGVRQPMTAAPSSYPQPPPSGMATPRALPAKPALAISPHQSSQSQSPSQSQLPQFPSSTDGQSLSGITPQALSPNTHGTTPSAKPVRPKPVAVYRSMLDIGPYQYPTPQQKDSASSASGSPTRSEPSTTEITRQNSEGSDDGQAAFGDFSLSPIATNTTLSSTMDDLGSDKASADWALPKSELELSRATTSPNLLMMFPPRPQRPAPAPLSRSTSSAHFSNKRLPDLPPPSPNPIVATKTTEPQPHPAKESFFKRVGSFVNKKNTTQKPKGTGVTSRSPTASSSGSPPAPRSRENTVDDYEATPNKSAPAESKILGHGHSVSSSHMAEQPRATTPRMGITWGPNYTEDGTSVSPPRPRERRRSISQDNLSFGRKKGGDPDAPVELMATFSFRSAEGVGMKSRRLSTSLPDEFQVDSCELNSEFTAAGSNPFVRGKTVGKGATAIVKLMYKKGDPSKALYAAKEFRRKDKAEDELEYVKKVQSEFTIARSAHHPNIVRTVRLCTNHQKWNHVMEYCSYGELYHWIEKGVFRSGLWKVSDRQCLFKQLLRGVEYLHSHGIAHRDIKLENLLINQDGHLKITDFGVSDVFSGEHPGLRTAGGKCGKNMGVIRRSAPGICGSLPYIAPEVLEKNGDYDPRPYDVWSCAIVYMVMMHGGNPWAEARVVDRFYKEFKQTWDKWLETHPDGEIKDEPKGCPPQKFAFQSKFFPTASMRRLILKMLHPDPDLRPTMQDILYSREVKAIEVCTPEACDEDGNELPEEDMDCSTKDFKKTVRKKHTHIPPKEHKTPDFFRHRFDMGDGYR